MVLLMSGLNPLEDLTDESDTNSSSFVGGGDGAIVVTYSPKASVITGGTRDALTLDIYIDLRAINEQVEFEGLTSYDISIGITGGWSASVDSMSGSTGFSWANDLSLSNAVGTTIGVLSVNNLLSNSAIGGIALIAGEDVSGNSTNVKIGTMTIDLKDSSTLGNISGELTGSVSDSGNNIISIGSIPIDIY